ncbi:hypothetical protein RB195_001535 [Necator americanus]|uniref:Major facilitator superfamily (MFS) profile domain-containing protein n=1 Tax=Necator americanus TaxID=51031 RepID=A0ABR1DER7_NECAM
MTPSAAIELGPSLDLRSEWGSQVCLCGKHLDYTINAIALAKCSAEGTLDTSSTEGSQVVVKKTTVDEDQYDYALREALTLSLPPQYPFRPPTVQECLSYFVFSPKVPSMRPTRIQKSIWSRTITIRVQPAKLQRPRTEQESLRSRTQKICCCSKPCVTCDSQKTMLFGTGTWRADFLVLHGYQLCQFYSSQQLFPISLNYVPPVKCVDDYCFEVKAKCYAGCPQCPDVCLNSTLLERDSCRNNYEPHFYSAAMEYEQYCKDFYRAYVWKAHNTFYRTNDRYTRLSTMSNICKFAYFLPISVPHRHQRRRCASLQTNGRLLMTALTHGGWLAGTWRLATYYHACASLLALAVIFVLPESPLWLRRKGYHEREEKARRKLTWIKGLKYKEGKEELKKEETAQQQMLFCNVFNDAELRVSFLVLCVIWSDLLTRSFLGWEDLLFGEKGSTLYFITYLTAYNSISVSWEPNFLGAAELMPTDVRGQTTAMLNIISRLANVFASQVIYFRMIYEPAILILLIISNVTSFVVTIKWLKGTKNINLEGIGGSAKPKNSGLRREDFRESSQNNSTV